jgi:hypothetical protein
MHINWVSFGVFFCVYVDRNTTTILLGSGLLLGVRYPLWIKPNLRPRVVPILKQIKRSSVDLCNRRVFSSAGHIPCSPWVHFWKGVRNIERGGYTSFFSFWNPFGRLIIFWRVWVKSLWSRGYDVSPTVYPVFLKTLVGCQEILWLLERRNLLF